MALAALYWVIAVRAEPDYWSAMFPGLVLMGISGGLSQASMFAAAGLTAATSLLLLRE